MNSSKKDYKKLYLLQDKFLDWWVSLGLPFYLTGGTALGRFYLNHRYSDDLDFFVNNNTQYPTYISELIPGVKNNFELDVNQSLFADDFTRIFITEDDIFLKIEFINDVDYYTANPLDYKYGKIDTPLNILSNKITALVGRDEPKDIFDIIHLSLNYSFHWPTIFYHARQKAVINELDVAQRLTSFNVNWLESIHCTASSFSLDSAKSSLSRIANDFLMGEFNTLGKQNQPIETAKPLL